MSQNIIWQHTSECPCCSSARKTALKPKCTFLLQSPGFRPSYRKNPKCLLDLPTGVTRLQRSDLFQGSPVELEMSSVRPSGRPPALLIFHAPAGTEHVQSRARFVGPLCTCLVTFWLQRQIRTRLKWRGGETEGEWPMEGLGGGPPHWGLLCLRRRNAASGVLCHRREGALLWFASRGQTELRQLVCCSCSLILKRPVSRVRGSLPHFPPLGYLWNILRHLLIVAAPLA